jgi:integrase
VFPNAAGLPELPNTWIRREFYPARKAAGVSTLFFHDLRHFAVSQLIAQGADILQIARIAGHADASHHAARVLTPDALRPRRGRRTVRPAGLGTRHGQRAASLSSREPFP